MKIERDYSILVAITVVSTFIMGMAVQDKLARKRDDNARDLVMNCEIQLRRDSLDFDILAHNYKIRIDSLKLYRRWLDKARSVTQ